MREFASPSARLGDLDAEVAGRLIAAASDIALIVDAAGFIRDLAFGGDDLLDEGCYDWLGKRWADTVTAESREKVDALLRETRARAAPRWRHINHPSPRGADLPMSYAAVALPHAGRTKASGGTVVFGRDMRVTAALQQRLVSAQQSMERDYRRLRHMETRYRSLFQLSGEAVLIADGVSGKLEEANPAAIALFGADAVRPGMLAGSAFGGHGGDAVRAMLTSVGLNGEPASAIALLAGKAEPVRVFASLFRQDCSSNLLIRVASAAGGAVAEAVSADAFEKLIAGAPDAFVVTDLEGRILSANAAFIELAQLACDAQALGQSLERWLGRTGVDLNVLISNLRQRGVVRLFATAMRGEYGSISDVEISAVAVAEGEPPCLGFTIRDVSRRLRAEPRARREMPRSVGQMTELVGRVPLKDIVRDTTDLIEQLCIEAALELTHDNRACAAEMLGLSRQSLYVKLRRFNLGDLAAAPNEK